MNIYLISGLGADKKAFQYLTFPKGTTPIFIDWIEAFENETIETYSKRLSQEIDSTKPFILIGLSFGGMIASEICTFMSPQKTILVSSINCYNELPFIYKIAGKLRLHKLIPTNFNKEKTFLFWLFGVSSKNDKNIVKQAVENANPTFIKWAIHAILNWKKVTASNDIIRIHGDKDKILPITNFTPTYLVKNGGHLMVATKAAEISKIIASIITL